MHLCLWGYHVPSALPQSLLLLDLTTKGRGPRGTKGGTRRGAGPARPLAQPCCALYGIRVRQLGLGLPGRRGCPCCVSPRLMGHARALPTGNSQQRGQLLNQGPPGCSGLTFYAGGLPNHEDKLIGSLTALLWQSAVCVTKLRMVRAQAGGVGGLLLASACFRCIELGCFLPAAPHACLLERGQPVWTGQRGPDPGPGVLAGGVERAALPGVGEPWSCGALELRCAPESVGACGAEQHRGRAAHVPGP